MGNTLRISSLPQAAQPCDPDILSLERGQQDKIGTAGSTSGTTIQRQEASSNHPCEGELTLPTGYGIRIMTKIERPSITLKAPQSNTS